MEMIWSNSSKKDLKDFFDHIHEGTETIAKNYILNLIDYTSYLKNNPHLGRILFFHNNLEYRMLIYKKHKVLYTITDKINIVSVIHTSRNLKKVLKNLKF